MRRNLARAQHAEARRKKFLEEDQIKDLKDLKLNYKRRLSTHQNWTVVQRPAHIVFMKMDYREAPVVDVSVKFLEDFSVVIHSSGIIIPSNKFIRVLGVELRCDKWSVFENFMTQLYNMNNNNNPHAGHMH